MAHIDYDSRVASASGKKLYCTSFWASVLLVKSGKRTDCGHLKGPRLGATRNLTRRQVSGDLLPLDDTTRKFQSPFLEGGADVKKRRFTEQQIIGFLKEPQAGMPVKGLCRKQYVSTIRD